MSNNINTKENKKGVREKTALNVRMDKDEYLLIKDAAKKQKMTINRYFSFFMLCILFELSFLAKVIPHLSVIFLRGSYKNPGGSAAALLFIGVA